MLWLACAQEGARQSLPVISQGKAEVRVVPASASARSPSWQCIVSQPQLPSPKLPVTFSPPLQHSTFSVWAERKPLLVLKSLLLSHDSNLLEKTTCWRPASFLGDLILKDPLMQAKAQGKALLHTTGSLPVAASPTAAAALAGKAFKFSKLRRLPSLKSCFLKFFEKKLKIYLLWMCVFSFIVNL